MLVSVEIFPKFFLQFFGTMTMMKMMIRVESVKMAVMLDREKIFPKFFLEKIGLATAST